MEIILTMDVPDVGSKGDRVNVAPGFARNYLFPRQLAVPVTRGNLRAIAEDEKLVGVREKKSRREADKVAEFLTSTEVFTTLKIGREGKAFGAITSKDLAVLLKKAGLEMDRRRIRLEAPIRRMGVFDVALAIHSDVATSVKVYVDREGGSKDGAMAAQAEWEEERRAADEAARAEAEEQAARDAEAARENEAARKRAEARAAREAEAAKAAKAAESSSKKDESGEDGPAKAEGADEDAPQESKGVKKPAPNAS